MTYYDFDVNFPKQLVFGLAKKTALLGLRKDLTSDLT